MTQFWFLEPEVAGGLGPSTRLDHTTQPPTVHDLEYRFDGWLGDDILESFPVFLIVTEMAARLKAAGLTGAGFADVRVTETPEFSELQPDIRLPSFVWLKPSGIPGVHDFGVAPDHRLVISNRALAVLRTGHLEHAEISPWGRS